MVLFCLQVLELFDNYEVFSKKKFRAYNMLNIECILLQT